ncbi:2-oxoglutarate dehydrogenase E1 component [Halofilum ochraceum]|uniref:2-oxoglutarate dehydrogenase E1 component n=1 Tax=Halofilum ochraceum TaxID=1611323 RepID=UPI00082FFA3F|nr:2-oxoglutarate dehydrogenase E1 component [Halofilum ochraceum]
MTEQSPMQALWSTSLLDGGNGPYLEALYEAWLRDPASVPDEWRRYFDGLPQVDGVTQPDMPPSEVRAQFYRFESGKGPARTGSADARQADHERKQIRVLQLINAYRFRGHRHAKVDPLDRWEAPEIDELRLDAHDLSEADLDTVFHTGSLHGLGDATLREILDALQKTYCGSIGAEYMHIADTAEKRWLQNRMETPQAEPNLSAERRRWLLERLTAAEGIERYMHSKYVGQKRFSLEGGESLIPMLNELVERAGDQGAKEVVLGMAHRGRLNVLVNIFGKKPADLFQEFEGHEDDTLAAGDVKYHQGFSSDYMTNQGPVHLALGFNPSHLEIVNPVIEGSARSRQDRHDDRGGKVVLPILVHGDAAMAGQGVMQETLNLSQSRGYSTRGTVHVVINNQIGFTTSNKLDTRSSLYCTDVAKMINAPIFHVNGDDPEAVLLVTQIALDYRNQFHKDVVIDMVCYRRHGHNEADEPSATQPMMYRKIKALPTTRELYAKRLSEAGEVDGEQPDQMVQEYRDHMDAGDTVTPKIITDEDFVNELTVDWSPFIGNQWNDPCDTTVAAERLRELWSRQEELPEGFELHKRVAKIQADRGKMAAGALPIDWGFAEIMAYASLVTEGYGVRLSGQDSGRGTFFHRHAVLHNQADGSSYVPLRKLGDDQANFLIIDSLLSEEAVLAFEYGYSTADPRTMVIWEAQFGDFVNGAQVVIDQFISSGEAKWGRLCGLTLFLPHGQEGQGPEHSSARLERFLQLCAEQQPGDYNMQVCVPTTPAQAFHMIRRQMLRPYRKPLVVMTPKSLLRHKLATSSIDDLADGHFHTVISDTAELDPKKVRRVVICTGKVYYDLYTRRQEEEIDDIAIVRVEQLYPFPYTELGEVIAGFPNASEYVWCQEEPRNQGAWYHLKHRLERVLGEDNDLRYAGRAASPSPAVGYHSRHAKQQHALVVDALDIKE